MINNLFWISVVSVIVLGLSACTPISRTYGYAPMDDELEFLEVGSTTKNDVVADLGVPVVTNQNYGDDWIYVSSRFERRTIEKPKEVSRRVVVISFDEESILSNVSQYSLEDGRVVSLKREVTETDLGRLNIFQQIIRSVGRIDPTSIFRQN